MKSSNSSSAVKYRFEEEEEEVEEEKEEEVADFRLMVLMKLMISLSAVLASGQSGCIVHFSHFSKRIANKGNKGCL